MTFTHANDAAMGNLDYERREADFYATPAWCTEALIPHLKDKPIHSSLIRVWEPACGDGAMSRVLERHFQCVHSTDLHERGYGVPGVNFLGVTVMSHHVHENIITNPPYNLAEAFIRHALSLTRPQGGFVAMLLRNEFDSANGRNDLFNGPPFAKKVVLTSRPRWIEGTTGSPRHNYAWFIWDWSYDGPPLIGYGGK